MPISEHEPDVVSALEAVLVGSEVLLRHGRPRPATVAVCIPVRNAEATLGRCLDSVLGQQGVDLRAVVVDNDSTDRTFAIATARAARDPRVVVYRNPRDVGRIGNWNRCLELVGGCTYAKLLMASDELLPGFLAWTVAAMDAHPSAVLLRASLSFRHPDGRVEFLPHFGDHRFLPGVDARRISLTEGNLVANPSGQLWRTGALDGLRFDESLPWASDYDFALSLLRRGDYVYLREQLYVFDLGAGRFHTATAPAVRFADECAVAVRHGGPEALPLLERAASELGGGPELEAILAEARRRLEPVPALDVRGTSFLLELADGWRDTVRDYVDTFRPDDDVTLVLKPRPGDDVDAVVAAVLTEIGDGETADVLLEPGQAPAAALASQVTRVLAPGESLGPLLAAFRSRVS